MQYVIYTEIHSHGSCERWYYGVWSDADRADEVALELGHGDGIWHCVCRADEATALRIQNMPF